MAAAIWKTKKGRLIIILSLIFIVSVVSFYNLRRGNAIKNYKQGAELLRLGDYKAAVEKLQKSVDFWPRGWWFNDAQNKLLYCKINAGANPDTVVSGRKIVIQGTHWLGAISFKIILVLLVIGPLGVIFIKFRAKRKKKEQEYLSYIQNVGKKIKGNVVPAALEKFADDLTSAKDYQEYIDYCKEGEFVKLAGCLIAEYYLKESPDSQNYINKTVESYKNLLGEYPGSIFGEEVTYKLANLYFFRLGNYDEATGAYQRIIEKYPDSKWIKIAEARVNLIRDNSDYDRKPLGIYILAERYYENKKYEKALEEFRKVVSKYPETNLADDSLYAIGDIYMYKLNKLDEAIKEYQRIITVYPQSRYAANAQYKIGECYRKNKKITEGISNYKKFIDNYPESDFADYAYYYIGQCYEQEKDLREAKMYYEKLIANYPSSMWVVVASSRLEVLKDMVKENQGQTE